MNQANHIEENKATSKFEWKKIIIVSVIGILIAGIIIAAITIPSALQPIDRTAPDFSLTTYNGTSFCLSDFEGQVVVLNIMATACLGCDDQIAELQEIPPTFGNNVVLISVSIGYESDTVLEDYAEANSINWLFAADTSEQNVLGKYAVSFIPTTFIIDQERQKIAMFVGETEAAQFISEINQLLDEGILIILGTDLLFPILSDQTDIFWFLTHNFSL